MKIDTTEALSVSGHSYVFSKFRLVVVNGDDKGKTLVASGMELTIGTEPGNDLKLADSSVSSHHCAIDVGELGVHLRDLGSPGKPEDAGTSNNRRHLVL